VIAAKMKEENEPQPKRFTPLQEVKINNTVVIASSQEALNRFLKEWREIIMESYRPPLDDGRKLREVTSQAGRSVPQYSDQAGGQ
jgi:hypothetical protein